MQFISLDPLEDGRPLAEVRVSGTVYDLHNDAVLDRLEIDFEQRRVGLHWKTKTPAWKSPELPEPTQRRTVAGLSMILSSVRTVRLAGEYVSPTSDAAMGIDFFEYHRLQGGVGEIRVVFDNESEIVVRASRCEVLLMTSQP
ncbi:MAG: hypothetical protein ACT4P6_10875 [Gemmatimonadaceae bacterium]